jgi:glycosyltransferase involved in cell wall biosynthesis
MFHLPYLAAALNDEFVDYLLVMGLYPLPIIKKILSVTPIASKSKSKILERQQDIPQSRVLISLLSELLAHAQSISKRLKLNHTLQNQITNLVHSHFSKNVSVKLLKHKPMIYHYRCAFGLESLKVADRIQSIKLCDHSIAHPAHIQYLIDNHGKLPCSQTPNDAQLSESSLLCMKLDLDNADHIVVNSSFVRKSLVHAGIPSSCISVIEVCVDQRIIQHSVDSFNKVTKLGASSLIYAGGWIKRKGVVNLAKAIEHLDGRVSLRIAGASEDSVNALCHEYNVTPSNLKPLGYLSRQELALELLKSQIFVFPSFCEGYAKTIQEAMVCGCYIIATENSGFSLFPGAYGTIVEPGDTLHLAEAIAEALADPLLLEYGRRNREVALKRFSPQRYANRITKLYQRLLQNKHN